MKGRLVCYFTQHGLPSTKEVTWQPEKHDRNQQDAACWLAHRPACTYQGTTCIGMMPPTVGWGLLYQFTIRTTPHSHTHRLISYRQLLSGGLDDSRLWQVDVKANWDRLYVLKVLYCAQTVCLAEDQALKRKSLWGNISNSNITLGRCVIKTLTFFTENFIYV